ncbi:MAG: hypothetical protein H7123_04945 [Thermoleophilia bacterium]|nr:hypothetical protein [Thermoleophilia bacterium]
MMVFQRPFRDLVLRQIALFASEHSDKVLSARAALRAYDDDRDPTTALERYADHDDLAEDVELILTDMCERYASTLEPRMAKRYVKVFTKEARKVYGDLLVKFDPYYLSED